MEKRKKNKMGQPVCPSSSPVGGKGFITPSAYRGIFIPALLRESSSPRINFMK